MGVIKGYTAPVATADNKYTADVAELVELVTAGEEAAYEIVAQTKSEKRGASYAAEKRAFQTAARDAGYTARVAEETADDKAGTTRGVFVLKSLIVRAPREDKPQADADAE